MVHGATAMQMAGGQQAAAELEAEIATLGDDRAQRWDGESVHAFDGTYGDYILRKIGRVFPALFGG